MKYRLSYFDYIVALCAGWLVSSLVGAVNNTVFPKAFNVFAGGLVTSYIVVYLLSFLRRNSE